MIESNAVVSVVIPTFNSASTLPICLESVRSQTYKRVEVIIVDRYSRDETLLIAKSWADITLQSKERRSSARNQGAAKSSGQYVIFIDSDMKLDRKVIEECVFASSTASYDAVTVPETSFGEGYWSKCIQLEKHIYLDNALIESPCFFRKDRFFEIGGYSDEMEAGEDWDLNARFIKNNCKLGRISSFIQHNEGNASLRKMFLKKYVYGQTMDAYAKINEGLAKRQLSPQRFANSRSLKGLMLSPQYGFGLIFMKSIQFAGLWFGLRSRFPR